jgi:transposase
MPASAITTASSKRSPESYIRKRASCASAVLGALSALAFALVLEDPYRFETSRTVGAYLGLVPGKDQSGDLAILNSASPSRARRC